MSLRPLHRGVYLAPGQVLEDPTLLARLKHADVDHIVLRSGFNPSCTDRHVEPAAEKIRQENMGLVLLVGGWWGEGIDPGTAAMVPINDDLPTPNPHMAHESQWPMHCPLGPWTQTIAEAATALTRRITPDAICLTHARFHHAADLPGLFTRGSDDYMRLMESHGLSTDVIGDALQRLSSRLRQAQIPTILSMGQTRGLVGWLDAWVESDVFSRWFEFRRSVINQAVSVVRQAVKSTGESPPAFGVNMLNPLWCDLSGQSPTSTMFVVDFVQPLLGYVHWHILQPLWAWSNWLMRMQPALDRQDARRIIARAIGLEALADLSETSLQDPDSPPAEVLDTLMDTHRQHLIASGGRPHAMQIVLRGIDWPADWLVRQQRQWEQAGFNTIVYQGIDNILKTHP